MARLILASSSPRRRELLKEAGYKFDIISPSMTAECGICSQESPPEFVARMAFQKAEDVVKRLQKQPYLDGSSVTIVIACDTVAECAGQILGKPADVAHARSMLNFLSGREHHVYSGLCLWELPAGATHVKVDRTTLQMERLNAEQLEDYLASELWDGKAGAFGYQDRVGWLRIVEGSESNVVGLPMELLQGMLDEFSLSHYLGSR